ncbi:hypothetical protein LUZ61_010148 [Rhynchospora tenuis]|uniref:Vacuolar membrane protease n=1 Tax=Rhynchospora tenuis TaxID=198213 RepID=A0AAD5ZYR4_9POAL|nr:hypothetical protein LUZ61_010148 [Rhynchospora tenuis]
MRSSSTSQPKPSISDKPVPPKKEPDEPKRSAFLWFTLLVLLINGAYAVYHIQSEGLPFPLTAEQAGKRGFSEESAMKHVKYLTSLGPHPVGSDSLDLAIEYVHTVAEKIKKTAHWEVDVEVDLFHAETGTNRLSQGAFSGRTLLYSDLKHVVLRIVPKYLPEARENTILVSSHIDTVFSGEGAGDCSSCIAVMLELARGVSQWAHGFKSGVIFLFNTGEEEGLDGAHSFITQHPWSSTISFAIDLEAVGIGGKSGIFQGGSAPWALDIFASVSKYPSAQITAQDLFVSGAIKSATDFQIYQEVAGLPGLDFAYSDNTAVYHTKNDKMKLLKPGSLQHLGDNMLAFLLHTAATSKLYEKTEYNGNSDHNQAIYFDILGMYMVVYTQKLASMLHNSVIFQSLLILATSLAMGGRTGGISFLISLLTTFLMFLFSLSFSSIVAFLLPFLSTSPAPYIASPWLVIGLFGAPALVGALTGQHIGFVLLKGYIKKSHGVENLAKLEAERWLFKAGIVQWLVLLILGNYFKVGSSYLALFWLASPSVAYGLMEATLTPARSPRKLKVITLIVGIAAPVVASTDIVVRVLGNLIGTIVRLDRNPGGAPVWLSNALVAIYISLIICLMLVHLLSYIHLSGAKLPLVLSMVALLALSLGIVSTGVIPAFTDDISRTVNVVHVVDTTENYIKAREPLSYISLYSNTPGKLSREIENLKDEEFLCGRNNTIDFVTFTMNYGCLSYLDVESGWTKSEIPTIQVESDSKTDGRETLISIDTKSATRWTLAINMEEIADFTIYVGLDEVVTTGNKTNIDGWHIIQFAGGKSSPTKFKIKLFWSSNSVQKVSESPYLLKLRADVPKLTPRAEKVLNKLPKWTSQFGKSTSPFNLAFLASLPVKF